MRKQWPQPVALCCPFLSFPPQKRHWSVYDASNILQLLYVPQLSVVYHRSYTWRNNRACKACSARGPSAVGGPRFARRCFLKVFLGEEGALLEYLHAGPLQTCYATVASGLAVDLAYLGSAFYMFLSIFSTFNLLVWDYFFMFLCSYFLVFIVGLVVRNSVAWDDVNF